MNRRKRVALVGLNLSMELLAAIERAEKKCPKDQYETVVAAALSSMACNPRFEDRVKVAVVYNLLKTIPPSSLQAMAEDEPTLQ